MTFSAMHTRALVGSNITVGVVAAEKESIASVTVLFDGAALEEIELADGTESYSRTFSQIGNSGPTMEHTLIVTAIDAGGAPHSATTRWTDA